MKSKRKGIVSALLLAGVLLGAVFAYRQLVNRTNRDMPAGESGASSQKQTAPDMTVTDGDGKTIRLSSLRGKPVVLNFWASWCPPCQSEMPDYQSLYQQFGDKVAFVMVDMVGTRDETVNTAKAFLAQHAYTFPAYFDTIGSAANIYGVQSIPQSYYINKSGVVRSKYEGMMQKTQMETAIRSIL